MQEHWEAGRLDMLRTLERPLWREQAGDGVSLRVYDMTRPEPPEQK
jgi:hypothetical protein